ncbi:MAG TPA: hypothetical protein VHB77_18410 [Planctomycetaceae bacterium]|nr:hypothetical protein [Planctomycetaceae bacterium]
MGSGPWLRCLVLALLGTAGCVAPQVSDRAVSGEPKKPATRSTALTFPPLFALPAKAKPESDTSDKAKEKEVAKAETSKHGKSHKEKGKDAKASEKSPTNTFDPTTLALIQSELRDATPEEREAVLNDLKGVSPDMVPKILNIRRMTIKQQEREKALARKEENSGANPAGEPNPGSASPAAVVSSSPNGLGTRSPWDRGATTPLDNRGAAQTVAYSAPRPNDPLTSAQAQPMGARANAPVQLGQNVSPATAPNGWPQVDAQGHFLTPNGVQPPPFSESPIHHAAGTASGNNALLMAAASQATGQLPPGQLTPGQYQPAFAPNTQDIRVMENLQRANFNPNGPQNSVAGYPPGAPMGAPAGNTSWNDHLQRLIAVAETEVGLLAPGHSDLERQTYIEKHVYLRMLYLMAGRHERAVAYIPGLDPADQEFWQQTLYGIANYFNSREMPNASDRAAQTISQFTTAMQRLKDKANLELRNVAFCQKVEHYGVYERFQRDEFFPGQPVVVYFEAANFHSEATSDGRYRTLLKARVEIHKPGGHGELIEQKDIPVSEDLCRNHRRDYYTSFLFDIPKRISLGPHVLKLIVEDQLSKKVSPYSLNFTVR